MEEVDIGKELSKNYDNKIIALKEQIQRIIGGIEVLEKLKEEIKTPTKKEQKWYFTVMRTKWSRIHFLN